MANKEVKTVCDILKRAGYPRDFVVLDFETYFDDEYSLTTMNTWDYVLDPRFEVLCLGVTTSYDNELHTTSVLWPAQVALLFQQVNWWKDKTVIMQNARFDQMILEQRYGIQPSYVIDLKHLYAQVYPEAKSRKLKDMVEVLGLPTVKGVTEKFKGFRLQDMDVPMREALIQYTGNDVDLETGVLLKVLPKFSCPEVELRLAQHTTSLYLHPTFDFDFDLAGRLLENMQKCIDDAIEKTGLTKKQLGSNKEIINIINAALPDDDTCPMKQGKLGKIPALAKADDGAKYLLNHPSERVREIMLGRQAVKSWPKEINRVENMTDLARSAMGKLPVPIAYCAAHTGRWQGTDKINLYNLGGKGRAGKENHPMLGRIRQLLRAPEGRSLLVSDSAQIEARVLAWVAGQWDLVTDFANNADPYSKFATGLFGVYVRKSMKSDPPQLAMSYELNRGVGKEAILGAGYGMGSDKFYSRCLENDTLRPLFDNGTYDHTFTAGLIRFYRTTYDRIPKFWYELEKMFLWVIKYPTEVIRYAPKDSPLGAGHDLLTLWNEGGTVYIQLPSGRCLVYERARFRKCDKTIIYGSKNKLWGGTLAENVVQSIARDLLGYWILECEKADLPVIFHLYDEIVSFSLDTLAPDMLQLLMNIMSTVPDWATGMPAAAEGKIMKAYEK